MRRDLSDHEGRWDRSVQGSALCCLAEPGVWKGDDHLARIDCPLFDDGGMTIEIQDESDFFRTGSRTNVTNCHRSERSGSPPDMVLFGSMHRQHWWFVGCPSPASGRSHAGEIKTEEGRSHDERAERNQTQSGLSYLHGPFVVEDNGQLFSDVCRLVKNYTGCFLGVCLADRCVDQGA